MQGNRKLSARRASIEHARTEPPSGGMQAVLQVVDSAQFILSLTTNLSHLVRQRDANLPRRPNSTRSRMSQTAPVRELENAEARAVPQAQNMMSTSA